MIERIEYYGFKVDSAGQKRDRNYHQRKRTLQLDTFEQTSEGERI